MGIRRFVGSGPTGGSVLVAVPKPKLSLLRSTLSDRGDVVHFFDMREAGINPARIIPLIETFVDGSLVLTVEDQTLGLGKVGLVLFGESSLLFDTLHAIPLFSHRPLSTPPAY